MKTEVNSAVEFVINILRLRQQSSPLNESQLHDFRGSLVIVLLEKYNNHWYESNPRKGKVKSYDLFIHLLHCMYKISRYACLFSLPSYEK